ncbi:sulfite exporter TauE/SafE family protein [Immundisolibacter sp.]|uniref:sulfite exporter TauE/SafE family protein n=1 Tax=Immundisolibacter sp. TaxID=1934948 RepID=UPI00263709CA|nr:sulfite exporter TauE/SafE family protein [Immundisolibacter sp.]MDD3650482.1 sulfite exporter TauE/SafE family protein [Immundisolibacter sp.]
MILLAYLAVGVAAGLIAGMLGLGGGVVIVPALALVFPLLGLPSPVLMHLAIGTSLAVIVPTSISSTLAHYRRGAVDLPLLRLLLPGLVPGALLGGWLADRLPSALLARVFGVFVIGVATQIFFNATAPGRRPLPGQAGLLATGMVIGTASTLLGIGGGSLTVPFLNYCRVDMRRAVATSSACGLVLGMVGAATFLWAGRDHPGLPPGAVGYLYLPAFVGIALASVLTAPYGARLAHSLPVPTLKRAFAVFLMLAGLRMLGVLSF